MFFGFSISWMFLSFVALLCTYIASIVFSASIRYAFWLKIQAKRKWKQEICWFSAISIFWRWEKTSLFLNNMTIWLRPKRSLSTKDSYPLRPWSSFTGWWKPIIRPINPWSGFFSLMISRSCLNVKTKLPNIDQSSLRSRQKSINFDSLWRKADRHW